MHIDRLTPRQRQVLELVAEGMSDREIAMQLGIKHSTVGSLLVKVFNKLGVDTRVKAAGCLWKERIANEWRGG